MTKLDDFEFGREATQDLIDFKDATRELLNNGKYQASFLTTNPPTHNAEPGEHCWVLAGGSVALYVARSVNTWLRLVSATT